MTPDAGERRSDVTGCASNNVTEVVCRRRKRTRAHRRRCRSVHVDDAADVRTHGVDGSMGAETRGVDAQAGGPLINHITDDVHLDLRKRGRSQSHRWMLSVSQTLELSEE